MQGCTRLIERPLRFPASSHPPTAIGKCKSTTLIEKVEGGSGSVYLADTHTQDTTVYEGHNSVRLPAPPACHTSSRAAGWERVLSAREGAGYKSTEAVGDGTDAGTDVI